jgi:hypothetical protein
MIELRP